VFLVMVNADDSNRAAGGAEDNPMITSDDPATSCALYVLVRRDGSLHPVISDESPDSCVARYNLGAGTDYSKGRLPVRLAYVFFDLKDRWDAWGIRDSFG
jgi:hypothetical protein